MKTKSISILFAIISIMANSLYAQNINKELPLPKGCISGKLDNGLKYIILKNTLPKKKVEFRLVVNVGSIVEDNNEKGVAHFLEHMTFNGSKKYPGNTVVQEFKKMGVKFGFGLNAFTGYDKTIYIYPVPTDKKENIDFALSAIKESITNLTFLEKEVNDERKVILQEYRDRPAKDIFYYTKIKGSKYTKRDPIGDESDINRINSSILKEFYKKWYRPDLVNIIAVGDIDPIELEKKIKQEFSDIKQKSNIERKNFSLKTKGRTDFKLIKDDSYSKSQIELVFPTKSIIQRTYKNLREKLVNKILSSLIQDRIKSLDDINCTYYDTWYLSDINHRSFVNVFDKEDNIYSKIKSIGKILKQIKDYPISKEELEDIKSSILEGNTGEDYERTSSMICNDYVDYFVTGDHYLSNSTTKTLYEKYLKTIDAKDIQKGVDFYFQNPKMIICARTNSSAKIKIKKRRIIRSWRKGLKSDVKPYIYKRKAKEKEEKVKCKELEVVKLQKSSVLSEKTYESIGIEEVKLSNGVTLLFKNVSGNKGEIYVETLLKGGLSLVNKEEYPLLESAAAYVDMGGVANLNYDELSKYMDAKDVYVSTNIGPNYHGIYTATYTNNVEDLFKLLYAKIYQARKNKKDFDEVKESLLKDFGKESETLKRLQAMSSRKYSNMILNYQGRIAQNTREFKSKEEINNANLDDVYKFYNKIFSNAMDMTVVISGSYDLEKVKATALKYIGSFKTSKTNISKSKFVGSACPKGKVYKDIIDKDAKRTSLGYLFSSDFKYSLKNTLIQKIIRDVVQNRLISQFREKLGMVYSPFVLSSYRVEAPSQSFMQIEYSCANDKVKYLEKALIKLIQKLKKNPIKAEELNGIVQSFIVTKREVLSKDNMFEWRKKIKEVVLDSGSISEFDEYEKIVKSISIKDIQEGFNKYFIDGQFIRISVHN
ncbi:insulinase family protein [Marinilabiliaceae bacterium JC040]|nr:insulinase family protein [Marinilabiliaceae bacterium JC040]